jgi:hypothetical protein
VSFVEDGEEGVGDSGFTCASGAANSVAVFFGCEGVSVVNDVFNVWDV